MFPCYSNIWMQEGSTMKSRQKEKITTRYDPSSAGRFRTCILTSSMCFMRTFLADCPRVPGQLPHYLVIVKRGSNGQYESRIIVLIMDCRWLLPLGVFNCLYERKVGGNIKKPFHVFDHCWFPGFYFIKISSLIFLKLTVKIKSLLYILLHCCVVVD